MEEPMSTLAVNDRGSFSRKPRAHAGHLWSVPSDPPAVASSATPVTVSITVDGGDPAGRDRVLAALRELVAVAGVEVHVPAGTVAPDPAGAISIDPRPRTVVRNGWPLHLSRLEYDLLLFLARHPRQVFSRSQLLAQVWGHTHTTLRTVDVHVSRLRQKLDGQELITTVYGLGYRLADDAVVQVAA
jgi:two-component system response regulator MtrA